MNPTVAPLLELRDIHAAPAPGLWPPAPGWWLLALLMAGTAVLLLLRLRRRLRKRRFRLQVMLELDDIAKRYRSENIRSLITETGIWLRRIALRCYPVEQVASLSGAAWLQFLDATGGGGEFSNGTGRVLITAPYSDNAHFQEVAVEALLGLARGWAGKNLEKLP